MPAPTAKSISGFDPLSISGCLLWFDGADTSTITGTSTVTSWISKGANSVSATNYSGSCTSENSYNGLNFVNIPGGTEMRFTTSLNTQARSWFVVARVVNVIQSSTLATLIGAPSSSTQNSVKVGYVNGANSQIGIGPSNAFPKVATNSAPAVILNSVFTASIVNSVSSSSNVITLNGVSQSLATSVGASGYDTSSIAYSIGDANYAISIDVMEILFYNRDVTPIERQRVEGYLTWKWGVNKHYVLPTTISGCQLWLDAADANSITSSEGVITSWNDKSGYSRHAVANNGSGVYNATGLNGRLPTVQITPSGNMKSPISSGTFPSKLVFFVVFQHTGAAAYYADTVITRTSANQTNKAGPFDMTTLTTFTQRIIGGTNGNKIYQASDLLALNTTPTLLNVTIEDSGSWTEFKNGIALPSLGTSSGIGTYNDSGNYVYLGTRGDGYTTMSGNISEVIMYNQLVSLSDRIHIELYLSYKWNIPNSNSFPSSHPFSLIQPFSRNFQPIDIPGCQLWLDAADYSTFTLTVGGSVTVWRDKSGNTNTATIGVVGQNMGWSANPNRVIFLGGYFTLTNGYSMVNADNGSYTLFVVEKRGSTTSGGGQYIFGSGAYTGSNSILFGYGTNTVFRHTISSSSNLDVSVAGYTTTEPIRIWGGGYSGSVRDTYLNGSLAGTGSFSTPISAWTTPVIGLVSSGGNNSVYLGQIHEILFFNSYLTSSQRQQVEGYLAWKWDLRSSLPEAHPFYNFQSSSALPFLPTNIERCTLWLDASQELGADGTSLASLTDRSGTGNNAEPVSGNTITLATDYRNRMPVYNFGTNRVSIPNFQWTMNFTVFIVAKASGGNFRVSQHPSGVYYNYVYTGNDNLLRVNNSFVANDSVIGSGTPVVSSGQFFLFCIGYTSGSTTATNYTVNGTVRSSGTGTAQTYMTVTQPQTLYINGNSSSASDTSWVAEMIYYAGTLTTYQRQQVEGYLANKWNI